MLQVFAMTYLWLKAGHIIFVVFWMAGLFMIPRFFVYHQEAAPESPENALWIVREAKLLKIILWPSLVMVWLLGLALAYTSGAFGQGWFQAKLTMVLVLSAYHFWIAGYAAALARGERRLTGRNLRLLNEIPGIAAAVIVDPGGAQTVLKRLTRHCAAPIRTLLSGIGRSLFQHRQGLLSPSPSTCRLPHALIADYELMHLKELKKENPRRAGPKWLRNSASKAPRLCAARI